MRRVLAFIIGLALGTGITVLTSCGYEPKVPGVVYLVVPEAPGCPSGGITLFTAWDSNFSGALEPELDSVINQAEVCHGVSATGQFSHTEILDPCGDEPGIVDEVLIRTQDGRILSSFSDNSGGTNTRFVFLPVPGSYVTTDGSNCLFNLDAEGNLL